MQQLALDAIGDRTRRAVLELLREAPSTVGDLANRLPVSRPAVSKHLKVLLEAQLVDVEQVGTSRRHRLRPEGLAEVRAWVEQFWDEALDAFTRHVEATAPAPNNKNTRTTS